MHRPIVVEKKGEQTEMILGSVLNEQVSVPGDAPEGRSLCFKSLQACPRG